MLQRFNMAKCSPTSTPLPTGLTLSIEDCPTTVEEAKEMENTPYQEALGSLMWLQIATRPDLSYAVNLLHNPGKTHWNALKHILAYIKGTIRYGITYAGEDLNPTGYVDSDFAGC